MNSTHKKEQKYKKNGNKDEKAINNYAYDKTLEELRNKINVKLVNNERNIFKMYIKTKLYFTLNIWQDFSCNTKIQSFIKA